MVAFFAHLLRTPTPGRGLTTSFLNSSKASAVAPHRVVDGSTAAVQPEAAEDVDPKVKSLRELGSARIHGRRLCAAQDSIAGDCAMPPIGSSLGVL